VVVRVNGASNNNYYAAWVQSDLTSLHLSRMDGGAETILQTISGLTIADNDLFKLQIAGTTLKVFQNGVQRGTDQADATYASGSAGIFGYSGNGELLDAFQANNLGSGFAVMRP